MQSIGQAGDVLALQGTEKALLMPSLKSFYSPHLTVNTWHKHVKKACHMPSI